MKINQFSSLQDRFFAQIEIRGECWEWVGRRAPNGYGQIKNHYKTKSAHRVSWELFNGRIPEGFFVCHKCDNRPCCNPSHLFLGTSKDNIRDAVAKNRIAHGERQGSSKLTLAQVESIRADPRSCLIVAPEYGVHFATIAKIRKGVSWAASANQRR